MKIKDLKELLETVPEDDEVLVANYTSVNRNATIYSYDEPNMNTFMIYDDKLLIKGYDEKTCFEYKRRIINTEDVEKNSTKLYEL